MKSRRRQKSLLMPATRTKLMLSACLLSVGYGVFALGKGVMRWTLGAVETVSVQPASPAPATPSIAFGPVPDPAVAPVEITTVAASVAPVSEPLVPLLPIISRAKPIRKALAMPGYERQPFTWLFAGNVTYLQQPCPNVRVIVRLSVGAHSEIRHVKTDENAAYRVQVPIHAGMNDAVDWSVEAISPEFQTAQMAGRRIVTDDYSEGNRVIQLNRNLDLVSSKI